MQSADDLNDGADALAVLYDAQSFHTAEPTLLGLHVADGGDPQAITFLGGGVAGPSVDHGAVDGITWSSLNTWTLTEVATHGALWLDGDVRRTYKLRAPVGGPDTPPFPYSLGIGPAAQPA